MNSLIFSQEMTLALCWMGFVLGRHGLKIIRDSNPYQAFSKNAFSAWRKHELAQRLRLTYPKRIAKSLTAILHFWFCLSLKTTSEWETARWGYTKSQNYGVSILKSGISKIIRDCNLYQAFSHFAISEWTKPELKQRLHLFKMQSQSFSPVLHFWFCLCSKTTSEWETARWGYSKGPLSTTSTAFRLWH